MDEPVIYTEPLKEGAYLSQAQIEVLQNKIDPAKGTLAEQMGLVTLADAFVRQNGRANAEYEALYDLVQKTALINGGSLKYDERIRQSCPVLFFVAYYNYLILIGVLSEEDLERIQREALRQMGVGPKTPQA